MRALLLVDIQNDFMPGGSLAVPDGGDILPPIRRLMEMPFALRIASKDWHPKNHGSFAETHVRSPGEMIQLEGVDQRLWPVHCVQDTSGSMFAPGWDVTLIDKIILKGTDVKTDSYSIFFDNARRRDTGLAQYLRDQRIHQVFIAGLAMDYCVLYSALDAIELGFDTYVITDACRGINVQAGDVEKALAFIQEKGGHLVTSDEIQ